MTLTLEAQVAREDGCYTVTVKVGSIPDRETCLALREGISALVAQAMVDMGASYLEPASTH